MGQCVPQHVPMCDQMTIEIQATLVEILAIPLKSCVALCELLNVSKLQCLYLNMRKIIVLILLDLCQEN